MEPNLRHPRAGETQILRSIWSVVFGGRDEDLFFSHYYEPAMCLVATHEDVPVAAGYLLPAGCFRRGFFSVPCEMIYGVAALSEHRNRGLGSAIVNNLILMCSGRGSLSILCPSEDSLFEYYSSRSSLRDCFYMTGQRFDKAPPCTRKVVLTEIPAFEYRLAREILLTGIPHIDFDLRAITYQSKLCREFGGGLFKASTPDGLFCAIVEKQPDGAVWIKELLTPPAAVESHSDDVLSAIACLFPSGEYVVRTPAMFSGAGRRFGMMTDSGGFYDSAPDDPASPWLGIAFD